MTFLFKIKIQTGGGSLSWTQAKKKKNQTLLDMYTEFWTEKKIANLKELLHGHLLWQ